MKTQERRQHAPRDCACDECFKPNLEAEARAAEWWRLVDAEASAVHPPLAGYERWMVKCNLEHAQSDGIKVVVARLRANGYHRVAAVVEQAGGTP